MGSGQTKEGKEARDEEEDESGDEDEGKDEDEDKEEEEEEFSKKGARDTIQAVDKYMERRVNGSWTKTAMGRRF